MSPVQIVDFADMEQMAARCPYLIVILGFDEHHGKACVQGIGHQGKAGQIVPSLDADQSLTIGVRNAKSAAALPDHDNPTRGAEGGAIHPKPLKIQC